MKLLQKSLLFATIIGVGAGVTSIPTINNGNVTVQAATIKNMTANGFYYKVAKDKFIKASDVEILNKDTQSDANMIQTDSENDYRLEVTTPKAKLYNLKGKEIDHKLAKGTVCKIGTQASFDNSTYYKIAKDKLVQSHDSSWL
ncbi:SLAP domain-containing protein [Companilactobacillus kimchiensis]|nr:SLAP domain-containing protein [Companilactobacillus kimchiensis]